MKIDEIMTKNPACCTDAASLREAAQMMAENNCGAIPVVENMENKKPIGMITDRDICIRTLAHNKNPFEMIVAEAMTDNPVTITLDSSVEKCCQIMERNQIRRLPVVDGAGVLCGIVSQADVARHAPKYEVAELVRDVSMNSYDEAMRSRDAFQML